MKFNPACSSLPYGRCNDWYLPIYHYLSSYFLFKSQGHQAENTGKRCLLVWIRVSNWRWVGNLKSTFCGWCYKFSYKKCLLYYYLFNDLDTLIFIFLHLFTWFAWLSLHVLTWNVVLYKHFKNKSTFDLLLQQLQGVML